MSLPLMEKEFDKVLKKALPYLFLSPDTIRDTVADYMKSLWLAMRNNNQTDFDQHCSNINESIANSDGCTDSFLQRHISDFDGRWSSLDESISKLRRELVELRIEVGRIKKDSSPVIDKAKKRKRQRSERVIPEVIPEERGAGTIGERQLTENPLENLEDKKILKYKKYKVYGEKIELYLETHDKIINKDVQKLFGVTSSNACHILNKLVKKNVLQKERVGKKTTYVTMSSSPPDKTSIETTGENTEERLNEERLNEERLNEERLNEERLEKGG